MSMKEAELTRIRIDENHHEQVIVLKEKGGTRSLPIVIGIQEANAIKLKIAGINPPRPLTHDLIVNLLHELGAALESVEVEKLENNIFFAKLVTRTADGKLLRIDARPSDGVAIAVRAGTPIYVSEDVLDSAST